MTLYFITITFHIFTFHVEFKLEDRGPWIRSVHRTVTQQLQVTTPNRVKYFSQLTPRQPEVWNLFVNICEVSKFVLIVCKCATFNII